MFGLIRKIRASLRYRKRGQQQVSMWTAQDRYPSLFSRLASMYEKQVDLRILSFGCSTGEELTALDKLYFRSATIHGVEIDEKALAMARKRQFFNNSGEVIHFQEFQSDNQTYDLILAMSVLCRWPETKNKTSIEEIYPFKQFCDIVYLLDEKLKSDGLLVVFNANYRLEDVPYFLKKYEVVELLHGEEEFVHKFLPQGPRTTRQESAVAFRKITEESKKLAG